MPADLPARIRAARKSLRLTQAQLGRILGVHADTVNRWEAGTLSPHPLRLPMVAAILRIDLNGEEAR